MAFRQKQARLGRYCAVSIAVGSLIHYRWYGADAMLEEFVIWISYVLMGAVVSVLLIFIWHWITVPARLVYEAEHERGRLHSQAIGTRDEVQREMTAQTREANASGKYDVWVYEAAHYIVTRDWKAPT